MADYLMMSMAIILIIIGIAGCFLPVIPGPPLSFLGLMVGNFTRWGGIDLSYMVALGVAAMVVTAIDYIIPVWTTRWLGGTRSGRVGATVGLLLGLVLFPPLGIILGPLIGAFAGELLAAQHIKIAFRSTLASFLGLMLGVGLKLVVSGIITYYFVVAIVMQREVGVV